MIHKFLCVALALAFPVSSLAAPAKAPIAAKSQIDARGVAALDKAVAFYRKQRSFAITATETVTAASRQGQKSTRSARIELSLQMPYRAALKVTALDANGQAVAPIASRLLGKTTYISSQKALPAQTKPIAATPGARKEIVVRMFDVAPSVALAIVAMAGGESPARDRYIQSVRYGEIREGKRLRKSVIVTRKGPDDSTPIIGEFRLSPRNFAVEEVVLRGQGAGKNFVVVTQFCSVVSNWKGSQGATDAAIYSWKKLAPRIAIAPPKPKAIVQIDPKARALFARAVELYSELDGLSVAWTQTEEGEKTNASFDFDRAGRVRIESHYDFEALTVIDGKNKWTLDESRANEAEELRYTREILDEDLAASYSLTSLGLSFGVTDAFYPPLDGVNSLDDEEVEAEIEGLELSEFRASILSAQPFGGQPCERVRITIKGDTTEQKTYWFARQDGRLMRYQERQSRGNDEFGAKDFQITSQTFNPTFAPEIFKFTPPKGAVLSKE